MNTTIRSSILHLCLSSSEKINSIAPGISWSNLESVVDNSTLKRRRPDGTVQVRPYSSHVSITNDSCSTERYSIEWCQSGQCSPNRTCASGRDPIPARQVEDDWIRIAAELPAGASQTFSVVYRNDHAAVGKPGVMWNAQAYLRRRLCEVRDNHLSKNQHMLTAAKALGRRFLRWS